MAMLPTARPAPAFFKNERLSIICLLRILVKKLPMDYSETNSTWKKELASQAMSMPI